MQEAKFIEVKRVVSEKESSVNTHSSPESFPIDSIGPFRAWKKGVNDVKIKGDMTLVIIKNNDKESTEKKEKTILIEESYESFKKRLGAYVIIKNVNDLQ